MKSATNLIYLPFIITCCSCSCYCHQCTAALPTRLNPTISFLEPEWLYYRRHLAECTYLLPEPEWLAAGCTWLSKTYLLHYREMQDIRPSAAALSVQISGRSKLQFPWFLKQTLHLSVIKHSIPVCFCYWTHRTRKCVASHVKSAVIQALSLDTGLFITFCFPSLQTVSFESSTGRFSYKQGQCNWKFRLAPTLPEWRYDEFYCHREIRTLLCS